MGCFDGGVDILEEVFDTKEEAEERGDEYVGECSVWDYRIIESEEEE